MRDLRNIWGLNLSSFGDKQEAERNKMSSMVPKDLVLQTDECGSHALRWSTVIRVPTGQNEMMQWSGFPQNNNVHEWH